MLTTPPQSWSLRIDKVMPEDSGEYECQVGRTTQGTVTAKTRLQVSELDLTAGKYRTDETLQKDEPSRPVLSSVVRENRRGEEYSERDKSLNKLLDVPWLEDEGVDGGGSTGTTLVSSLYPPILSVLLLSTVILVLGLVRTLGPPSQERPAS